MSASPPFVSVITPVLNGDRYLVECINSVLKQTYQNWEYIIVNNASTDQTLKIALDYARKDKRIRVVSNSYSVGVIENHNIGFRLISHKSRYCKVVSADDCLFPECIEQLVEAAEGNTRVAIVGSYSISMNGIRRVGLPPDKSVFAGRDVCRLYLLGAIWSFGTPSTVLYRSDEIRRRDSFYPGILPNGDMAACLACLESTDFAFVHEVLSYERIHEESVSAGLRDWNSFPIDFLQLLLEYGSRYLTPMEIEKRREDLLRALYACLAVGIVKMKGKRLLNYYRRRLEGLGVSIELSRLSGAVCKKVADLLLNPKDTCEKVHKRLFR